MNVYWKALALALLIAPPCSITPIEARQGNAIMHPPILPSLEVELAASERVVRAKIDQKAPMVFGGTGVKCGYRFEATVVGAFKGTTEPLTFFSDEDRITVGREYLLFVHRVPQSTLRSAEKSLADIQTTVEAIRLRCRSEALYYLPLPRQTFFEFDTEASKIFGGEWLLMESSNDRIGFYWCDAQSQIPSPTPQILRYREKTPGDLSTTVMSWDSAKEFLSRAMNNAPRLWGVVPNPLFKPGTC